MGQKLRKKLTSHSNKNVVTERDGGKQPVWTLFLFKSIWTRSQGSQGCQKSEKKITNKTVEFLR
jgi:hypothetical protein